MVNIVIFNFRMVYFIISMLVVHTVYILCSFDSGAKSVPDYPHALPHYIHHFLSQTPAAKGIHQHVHHVLVDVFCVEKQSPIP